MEDGNKISGELYPDKAPKTVENFETLANKGFYDGVIFHRVIPGFMIQGVNAREVRKLTIIMFCIQPASRKKNPMSINKIPLTR